MKRIETWTDRQRKTDDRAETRSYLYIPPGGLTILPDGGAAWYPHLLRVSVAYPKDGAGTLHAFVRWASEAWHGSAGGYGYDKLTAACDGMTGTTPDGQPFAFTDHGRAPMDGSTGISGRAPETARFPNGGRFVRV